MIVSRAPVRFSLGGGGTDLPSYANEHGGFLVAAAIQSYVFVAANRRFYDSIRLAYSKTEIVDSVDQIEHRIFRESLRLTNVKSGIELVSIADLPANSGLGSSSSFTVALLNALHAYNRNFVSTEQLAQEACKIEIDILKEPIGKQDQYIAAYGGITAFTFNKDGSVETERLNISPDVIDELESNLCIFYSGVERAASSVLKEQGKTITANKDAAVERMHRIKAIGYETRDLLLKGDVDRYGELLHEHWTNKRKLASNMTDSVIDEHYEAARSAGAIGGKLMGAGGGGFFMFYTRPADKRRVWDALAKRGLKPLRFRFDQDGARIVANFHRSLTASPRTPADTPWNLSRRRSSPRASSSSSRLTMPPSRRPPMAWPRCAPTTAASSCSASAARPATPVTRSTTSARSAISRPTRPPTTSRSSPPA